LYVKFQLGESEIKFRKAEEEIGDLTDKLSQKIVDLDEAHCTLHALSSQVTERLKLA